MIPVGRLLLTRSGFEGPDMFGLASVVEHRLVTQRAYPDGVLMKARVRHLRNAMSVRIKA